MTPTPTGGSTIAVFSLGGTIASTGRAGQAGVAPALSGADLVAAVPELSRSEITLDVRDFRRLPGPSLTFDDLVALSQAIGERLAEGAAGAVVTQGTDTIEETAYLLDLLHRGDEPVVVTGAMRNPTLAGADGPANLFAAVRTAASPAARGLGVLVVFGDEIHAARYVRKTHSTSITAFTSPGVGPIGLIAEGEARILTRPANRVVVEPVAAPVSARVALITMTLGDDGELLRAVDRRFDGLVVAGFGAGHVPAGVVAPLTDLASRIPVVLASRTGAGPVLRRTYGYPGSERDLLDRGLISAGLLDPLKARVLLRLLLSAGAERAEVAATFARVSAGATAAP